MEFILELLAGGRDLNADTYLDLGTIASYVVIGIAGLFLLLALIALIRSIATKWPERPGIFGSILLILLALGFGAGIYAVQKLAFDDYSNSIDAIFTKTHQSDSTIASTEADWRALANEIGAQGMTLLRNENAALPLQAGTAVNLLGYRAYDPVYSGSGSGSVSATDSVSFVAALEQAGFTVNPALATAYANAGAGAQQSSGIGFMGAAFTIDEPSLDIYTGNASFESMKAYSDIAIVVIGRTGGEGSDLTKFGDYADGTTDNIVTNSAEKHYLELSDEERALIQAARNTFGKVIVLYNGANAMELGFIEEYNVDAAIWVGIPGPYGLAELGNILNGTVNPSGHLPDTFAYDVYSAPSRENFGQQTATNATGEYYLDYAEGIYVGYKWYETAYAEGAVITNTHTGDTYDFANNYDQIVQYPFGYGLSYTTFEQKIDGTSTNTIDPMGSITVRVTVTNTGAVAGRDAIQLYLTSPYTDYDKTALVEKSAVQLLDFGKTKLLQPGESETIDLTIPFEEFAAWDSSHANADGTTGAYMLDAGEYILTIREDAHTEIARTSVTLANQFFYEGENKRPSDEVAATNQMDWAARGTYLSRNNAFANYATAMAVSPTVETSSFTNNPGYYDTSLFDDVITKNYVEGVDYAAPGTLTLADMSMASWDDPRWEQLISQLTLDEIKTMITGSVFGTAAVESVGKAKTSESDGPLGITSMFSTETHVAYPCLPLLSATFNKELAYTYGTYVADDAHNSGVTGWYAPAMNTHRSPFSGRNFEYYSEDGVLAAKIGAAETLGARDKGYIVYLKHFFLNDQETKRSGQMHTYTNEQAAREIYLRPFEACVKDGGATAIMNSMNYVGDKWIGVCYTVQENILRGEWGFHGRILTDMSEGQYMTNSSMAAIRMGTDMWLGMGSNMTLSQETPTNADIYWLQKVAKNILYAEANAEVSEASVLDWQPLVRFVQLALGGLSLACVLRLIGRIIRRARNKKAAAENDYYNNSYTGGHFGSMTIPYGDNRYERRY